MDDETRVGIDQALAMSADALKGVKGIEGVVVIAYDGERLLYEHRTKTRLVAAAFAREAAFTIHQETVNPWPADAKIANLDDMLSQVLEEDRAEMRAAIERMLVERSGRGRRAVQSLGPNEGTVCPACEEPLRRSNTPSFQHEEMPASEHYECTGCGGAFQRDAKVDA